MPLVCIEIGREEAAVLERINLQTGMDSSRLIGKILGGHLADLAEYSDWLETVPTVDTDRRARAVALVECYGPASLVDDLRELDPGYRTAAERLSLVASEGGAHAV